MAITQSPFLLKDVSLTLVKSGEVTTPVEYRCQLSQAELVPSAASGGGASLSTFCDEYSSPGGNATWVLTLSGFQAYQDAADLSVILFNDEGETYDFVLMPIQGAVSAANPAFEGQVTIVPTNIGGTANTYGVYTVSLPCAQKPLMVTVP